MRYSILDISLQEVFAVGGTDVKFARHSGIVFATLTPQQADQLKALGYVVQGGKSVKADVLDVAPPIPVAAVPTYSVQELAWAIGLEELRILTDPPLYGEGFNIAILDTGIRESHDLMAGRVVYRKNFTLDPMADSFNHGTGVASIAVTIAPLCGILNMKVLGEDGSGTEEEVIMAIEECIDFREEESEYAPDVMNLSLGSLDDGDSNNPLRVACRAAIAAGIWVTASAGNGGPAPGTVTCPACERYVAAVGSCKYEPFIVSDFSARGPTIEGLGKPEVVMFGEDIVMASSASDTATTAKSGTSFSVAFMAAVVLLYTEGVYRRATATRQLVELPPGELYMITPEDLFDNYLIRLCTKPEGIALGHDNEYGYGIPYGPFVAQAVGVVPGIDISSLVTGVLTIGMMGMLMGVMMKSTKGAK